MKIDHQLATEHKYRNLLHSLVLITVMGCILMLSSALIFGSQSWWAVIPGLLISLFIIPSVSPNWVLRFYQAQPVSPGQLPQLYRLISEISRRAKLSNAPQLFWIPSNTINAFAVGDHRQSAIAITQGLLQTMNTREIAGVLAHEISHIRNHDLRIMTFADVLTRMTHVLSMIGFLSILIALPFLLAGLINISLFGLFLLLIAPTINTMLQLGLSRIREFEADLNAVRITNDPEGLASALNKIEKQQHGWWQRIFLPGYRVKQPSVLRSHPDTQERIERLLDLRKKTFSQELPIAMDNFAEEINPYSHIVISRPRHRIWTGTWR